MPRYMKGTSRRPPPRERSPRRTPTLTDSSRSGSWRRVEEGTSPRRARQGRRQVEHGDRAGARGPATPVRRRPACRPGHLQAHAVPDAARPRTGWAGGSHRVPDQASGRRVPTRGTRTLRAEALAGPRRLGRGQPRRHTRGSAEVRHGRGGLRQQAARWTPSGGPTLRDDLLTCPGVAGVSPNMGGDQAAPFRTDHTKMPPRSPGKDRRQRQEAGSTHTTSRSSGPWSWPLVPKVGERSLATGQGAPSNWAGACVLSVPPRPEGSGGKRSEKL